MTPQNISEEGAKEFVVMLRRKQREILNEQIFCQKRNFILEETSLKQQYDLLQKIIFECEDHFGLGFVWHSSLD